MQRACGPREILSIKERKLLTLLPSLSFGPDKTQKLKLQVDMPGERFITSHGEDNQTLESVLETDDVCHVEGLMNIRLLFKLRKDLCGSCTCNEDITGMCLLKLCDTELEDCDNTHHVSKSCCASLCDTAFFHGAQTVWITVALVGVLFFLAFVVFIGIHHARRKQQHRLTQDLENGNFTHNTRSSSVNDSGDTSDSYPEPDRGLVEGTTVSQVSPKHDAASSCDILPEPSAPLLEHVGLEGPRVRCPALVYNSTETLDSDCLERNSPPPSYEDVIADDYENPPQNRVN